jgi:hypothetical protein
LHYWKEAEIFPAASLALTEKYKLAAVKPVTLYGSCYTVAIKVVPRYTSYPIYGYIIRRSVP